MKKVQFIIISTILSFGLIISAAIVSNAMDKACKGCGGKANKGG